MFVFLFFFFKKNTVLAVDLVVKSLWLLHPFCQHLVRGVADTLPLCLKEVVPFATITWLEDATSKEKEKNMHSLLHMYVAKCLS